VLIASSIATRRPNHHRGVTVQQTDRLKPWLAVVPAVIRPRGRDARKQQTGIGKIQPAANECGLALRFVEFDLHKQIVLTF